MQLYAAVAEGGPRGASLALAALGVFLTGAIYARFERWWRGRKYARVADAPDVIDVLDQVKETEGLSRVVDQAQPPTWFADCASNLRREDIEADRLQKLYHSCVGRCIAVLSIGVIIMCVSVIVFREDAILKKFATQFDLLATAYALYCFAVARYANKAFVMQRAFVESMRAWLHLAVLFPLEKSRDMITAYRSEKEAIKKQLVAERPRTPKAALGILSHHGVHGENAIYNRVEEFWGGIMASCRSIGRRAPANPAAIGFYLKERPLFQLRYYVKAQARIHEGQREREWFVLSLYLISVLLAVLKTLSVFWPDLHYLPAPDLISMGLLVVMVVSAATTNALISRNERSLLHSYHSQERRIKNWFDHMASHAIDVSSSQSVEAILAFEDLMLNELLDFVHITSRDVIEAPG